MRRWSLVARTGTLVLITALLGTAAGCAAHEPGGDTGVVRPTVGAATLVVARSTFVETLGAIGTVTGRVGHVATVSTVAPGRVARVLVSAGQSVNAGDVLVVLDRAPFLIATQAADAALLAAERGSNRIQRLAQEGIVPRKDAEQAAAELAKARSDAKTAHRALELSVLRAPIRGTVTRVSAALGAGVDPSQTLVEITDPSALDVLLSVTPADAARVHASAKVSLSAGEVVAREPLGVGTVIDVASTIDTITRTIAVRVRAQRTTRPLRVGETVFGTITVGTRTNAIVIPAEALVPEGNHFIVFVIDAHGIAYAREVGLGARSDVGVEIISGLKVGERIVTTGAYGVQDSAKVVPLVLDSMKTKNP